MNEKFFDLKKEKQDRMINGAMKVFALNGFMRASTDDMVKEAGISKGLWFHYFENKIGLYRFVTDYAVKYMNMELAAGVVPGTDYYQVIRKIEETKLAVRKFYPYIPLFLSSLEDETNPEALQEIRPYLNAYEERIQKCRENLDYEQFTEAVNFNILDSSVHDTLKCMLMKAYQQEEFVPEAYLKSATDYLNMMSQITFKV